MKIAINALNALAGAGVSGLINLLPEFERLDKENEYYVFISDRQKEIIDIIPAKFHKKVIKYLPQNPFVRVIWEQLVLPIYLFIYRIDILYSKANLTTVFAPCKIVLTIENSNPYSKLNLEWSKRDLLRNKLLKCLGWLSAKRSDKIIFVSDDSKRKIIQQLDLSQEKCWTIYHGLNSDFDIENSGNNSFDLRNNYLLTIGVILPHKNLQTLIQSFNILDKEYNYKGDLVIIGDIVNPYYFEKLSKLVNDLNLNRRVIFRGNVPYKEVKKYYKNADVFVLPSIEETFGMPLIEAMRMGIPIAASDCDLDEENRGKCFNPFKEICGDSILYFNPFDKQDMAKVINRIIIKKDTRNELIKKGLEKASAFPLEKTAMQLVNLFNSLDKCEHPK